MTKEKFLAKLSMLYMVGNVSDSSDDPRREAWTQPAMAGDACCGLIDDMMHRLIKCGAITQEDADTFYSTL